MIKILDKNFNEPYVKFFRSFHCSVQRILFQPVICHFFLAVFVDFRFVDYPFILQICIYKFGHFSFFLQRISICSCEGRNVYQTRKKRKGEKKRKKKNITITCTFVNSERGKKRSNFFFLERRGDQHIEFLFYSTASSAIRLKEFKSFLFYVLPCM